MFGGRIYSWALQDLLQDWAKDCPVERYVVRENMVFLTEDASLGISFDSTKLRQGRAASFTAVRAKFDGWLAKKAQEAGATLVTGIRVDDLWKEDGHVRGVMVAPNDRVAADVVVIAEGATSILTRAMGLKADLEPREVSVGVKETIELPAETIQERFGRGEEGDAAGFLINNGYTFRGVDLAIASGIAAGEAANAARAAGSMRAANLAAYDRFLRASNVLTDLERFRRAPLYMKNERLFDVYPRMLMEIAERMYTVDGSGKERLFDVVLDEASAAKVPKLKMLLDLLHGAGSM